VTSFLGHQSTKTSGEKARRFTGEERISLTPVAINKKKKNVNTNQVLKERYI
jgi:hypothetical protein